MEIIMTQTKIDTLIATLGTSNGKARKEARCALVQMKAVPALISALTYGNHHARWEAAKALRHFHRPNVASALVNALQDDNEGVRWLAAEALSQMAYDGLHPLLHALIDHSDIRLQHGAHHVLRSLVQRRRYKALQPVLDALDGVEPQLTTPIAAYHALEALESTD